MTDRYAVNIILSRHKVAVTCAEAANRASVSVDGKRVISIDPGARDLVTFLSHTEDHEE